MALTPLRCFCVDFVITAEAFYLMHHVRTFPFVDYKHNVIEALGHQVSALCAHPHSS